MKMYSVGNILSARILFEKIILRKFLFELLKEIEKKKNIALIPDDLNPATLLLCF